MKYDISPAKRDEVRPLFEEFHAYGTLGAVSTYLFAVYENDKPVAAYAWMPAPYFAAVKICPKAPQGVLSLSRMVAVPRGQRELKHISKPLKDQMKHLIDRTRWPVLVTYADAGQGHDGYVYKCAGWQPAGSTITPVTVDDTGARKSRYSNQATVAVHTIGTSKKLRFEKWACPEWLSSEWHYAHDWAKVPMFKRDGSPRRYKNGRPKTRYQKQERTVQSSFMPGFVDGISTTLKKG